MRAKTQHRTHDKYTILNGTLWTRPAESIAKLTTVKKRLWRLMSMISFFFFTFSIYACGYCSSLKLSRLQLRGYLRLVVAFHGAYFYIQMFVCVCRSYFDCPSLFFINNSTLACQSWCIRSHAQVLRFALKYTSSIKAMHSLLNAIIYQVIYF